MKEKMIHLTEELLRYNDRFLSNFFASKENKSEVDFDVMVKPFANEVKKVNDLWYESLNIWIKKQSPKHFTKKQVDSIYDQIQKQSIQCFYPKTNKTLFINTHKTVEYFLAGIVKELKRE